MVTVFFDISRFQVNVNISKSQHIHTYTAASLYFVFNQY